MSSLGSSLIDSLEQRDLSPSITGLVSSSDLSDPADLVALVSSIHTLLENKEISVSEMIDNDNISNLVLLFDTDNSDLILELLDLFVAIYRESSPEQRLVFVDLGIHNSLVNLLNDALESVLPQVLRSIASIVLVGQEEQINFSNNEIWPSLESVLQNFQDSIKIVKSTTFLLVALLKPWDGKHADIAQAIAILSTVAELGSYYADLYVDSENQSEIRIILDNLLLMFYALSVNDPSIPYYYSTFIIPIFDFIAPLLINSTSRLHSLVALKAVSNLVPIADDLCEDFISLGILDALYEFLHHSMHHSIPSTVSNEYMYWIVIFILGNLAAGGETAVESILQSSLFHAVNALIIDSTKNHGLFIEFVYYMSNLVCSANESQEKLIISDEPCVQVLLGMLQDCKDEEVCSLVETTISLLSEVNDKVSLQESMECPNADFSASSIQFDPFATFSL